MLIFTTCATCRRELTLTPDAVNFGAHNSRARGYARCEQVC